MKKIFLLFSLFFPALNGFSQIGTYLQYSNLPFWGINYEIKNRFKPELRLGTDVYFEDVSVEVIATYDILDKDDYELYAGLGGHFVSYTGFVLPVGMYLHPFQEKNFGFVFEVAPIFGEDANLLRGSVGLSYKFNVGKNKGSD